MCDDKSRCQVCNQEKFANFCDDNGRIVCKECLSEEIKRGAWNGRFLLFDNRMIKGHLPVADSIGRYSIPFCVDRTKNRSLMKAIATCLGGNAVEYDPTQSRIGDNEYIFFNVYRLG
ncbi:MAG: hypothetical protein GF403_02400 [Candidatus Coatesbacteria bacterium]|nr:hypothetical protein [Candidatus Coatesbacteria bacterium]